MRFALLLSLLLLSTVAWAPAEASTPPPRNSTWTVFVTVTAEVADNYAIVDVEADIRNRGPDPEFPFEVPVPADAMVTALTLVRDGQTYHADVAPREQARQDYEEHKAAEMTGGLVEKERGASIYRFLVNVAEFESVVATLRYEMPVLADRGVHTLPLIAPVSGFGQDLGAAFQVTVSSSTGLPDLWTEPAATVTKTGESASVRHSVGARPSDEGTEFTVRYVLPPTPPEGVVLATEKDGVTYFAHRFEAPQDGPRLPVDLALVLDVSGSMMGQKMDQLKVAARAAVAELGPEDRLHLTLFSSTPRSPWAGMKAVDDTTRAAARQAIDQAVAAGGTGIADGLRSGLGAYQPDGERVPVLLFMTDGRPTAGESDPVRLRALVAAANDAEARLFATAFGADADWNLVAGLARDGDGQALRVLAGDGAEADLSRFMRLVSAPSLRDVQVRYGEGVQVVDAGTDILFAGSELLVVGTFAGERGALTATVTATSATGPFERTATASVASTSMDHVRRMVVFRQIRQLEETIAAEGSRQEWVDQVVRLASEHDFVTDYTSLVLTLDTRAPVNRPVGGSAGPTPRDGATSPTPTAMPTMAPTSSPTMWPTSSPPPAFVDVTPTMSNAPDDADEHDTPGLGMVAMLLVCVALVALRRRS